MATYVMSIKKGYGMNLLEGKALWEYRRRKSKIRIGDRIILYAIAPDSELIGEFIVGETITRGLRFCFLKQKGIYFYVS